MPPQGGFPQPGGFAPQWGAPPQPGGSPFAPMPQMPPPGYAPMPGMSPPMFDPSQQMPMSQPMPEPQQPSYSTSSSKRRKQGSNTVLWVSIVGALLVVGGGLAYAVLMQNSGTKSNAISGELTATRRLGGKLNPVLVHREWVNLDEEILDATREHLKKHKYNLKSELIQMQFQGTDEGIKVLLSAGPGAELVSVEVNDNKKLASWHAKHSADLNEKAQKSVIRAAKKFVTECATAQSRGTKIQDVSPYHDELGIAAFATGVGGEIIAVIGDRVHRCVAEQEGKFFFLLPRGTDHFSLQGREHGKEKTAIFPGRYKVEVSEDEVKPKKNTKKPAEDEPSDEDKKDTERRTNSFGKPALNDPSAADAEMMDKPKAKKKAEPKKDE